MEGQSAREKLEGRLGKELSGKYRGIGALLALIDSRVEVSAGDPEAGLQRLFALDTLRGKKTVSQAALGTLALVLWAFTAIRYRSVPKAKTRLVYSNTFLSSVRYPAAREQIEKEFGCTAFVTFLDTLKPGSRGGNSLRELLRLDQGKVRPVFFRGWSVCGGALRRAASRYCLLAYGPDPDRSRLDRSLQSLEKAYGKRVKRLEQRLGKENVTLYTTINQYNLRDLLMIHACRNLGIRTLQQEHHTIQFCQDQFDENRPKPRLSFAGEYGFWNRTELLFHRKVYRFDSLLYPENEIRMHVTGNPEMVFEQAELYRQKYPPERKLTYMTAILENWQDPEIRDAYLRWRWDIYKGLKELSERQNIIINIRYRPFSEQEFREKEIPVLKEWGFRISESLPENLMEDLCSSSVIMSATSSVLSTARLFGKLTYRVEDLSFRNSLMDKEVHDVSVAGIPDIVIPEGIENTAQEIDREGTFNIHNIL